jgi:hypothetical protein
MLYRLAISVLERAGRIFFASVSLFWGLTFVPEMRVTIHLPEREY